MSDNLVSVKTLDKEQLKHATIFSGISPKAMRRVFAAWCIFCVVVAIIVVMAPDLSQVFQLTVFGVLIAFTLAMFGQSRIAEGWPAVLSSDDEICVLSAYGRPSDTQSLQPSVVNEFAGRHAGAV